MSVYKSRVENVHHFKGNNYPTVIVADLLFGITVGYFDLINKTGIELKKGQMVYHDDLQILGVVEN